MMCGLTSGAVANQSHGAIVAEVQSHLGLEDAGCDLESGGPEYTETMGAAYPVQRKFTFQEYLKLERAALTKSEYVDGEIFAMAGGTAEHDSINVNLLVLLQNQLKGGRCRARSADLRVAVSKQGPSFYPDVSVICGDPQFLDGRRDCVLNPAVVIEVQSRSTRRYDRETKVVRYQQIPSLRHIVLVSQRTVAVEHYFRMADGSWEVQKLDNLASTLELRTLPASLLLADIYDGLSL